MQKFIKDHSFINRIIFPAPEPQYTCDSFPRQLCWIPRNPGDRPDRETFGEEPLPTTDNRIPCLWLPYHRPSKRVIFYAHGNGEDLGNTHRFARMLRDNLQCHVIAPEYPGYGISPGVTTESSVNEDIFTAFQFLIDEMGFKVSDVLLFGRSIGSGPCCQLAARFKVGGLVLVSPFCSIREMTRHLAGRMVAALVADRFSNIDAIAKSEAPVIFIHGLADDLIPYSHSQQLFRASESASRRAIHFPEEMDHNNFDLKDDVILPIKLHFPDFFVRGSLHHKSLIPSFVFIKPVEYAALRDKRRHPPPPPSTPSPVEVEYGSSVPSPREGAESPPEATAESDASAESSFEYEMQLAHLSMMYPDLDEPECQHVLKLCKGNLARAAEIIVRLNLAAAGPTTWNDESSSDERRGKRNRKCKSTLHPQLHTHLANHRHNNSKSERNSQHSRISRMEGKRNSSRRKHQHHDNDDASLVETARNYMQSPPPSPPPERSHSNSHSGSDSSASRTSSLDVERHSSIGSVGSVSLSQSALSLSARKSLSSPSAPTSPSDPSSLKA